MEKTSVKVPFSHGTSGRWPTLLSGVGSAIAHGDPNPRAVYTAIANRRTAPHVEQFARDAVRARGGEPIVAMGKMDTTKGWLPRALNAKGKGTIGTLDDAVDLVRELDQGAVEPRRGEIWRLLQEGTGSWRNEDLGASLRPAKSRTVGEAYGAGVKSARATFGV